MALASLKTFLQVFLLASLLFVPPLGYMVNYSIQWSRDMQNALQAANLITTCINCCILVNSTGCENCSDRIVCEIPKAHKRKQFDDKTIEEIVGKQLSSESEKVKIELHKSLNNSYAAIANLENLKMNILTPNLPLAHVYAAGQPKQHDSGHMGNWQWHLGAERILETYPNMFDSKNGNLVAPLGGTYIIYVHTTFVSNLRKGNKTMCTLGHEIEKKILITPPNKLKIY